MSMKNVLPLNCCEPNSSLLLPLGWPAVAVLPSIEQRAKYKEIAETATIHYFAINSARMNDTFECQQMNGVYTCTTWTHVGHKERNGNIATVLYNTAI